jgi:hypothetical protein
VLAQPFRLLLPALDGIAHTLLARQACFGIRRVATAVHPGTMTLERDDLGDRAGEHLTILGDHQDRLARLADRPLELELGRSVEEVVRLVEQQDVGVGAQQHIEHELFALTARQCHRDVDR